ncbi:IniB N-terminal domain-containing protein [Actinokineospora cianjurensis]|uniref:Uncharacterized protein n=1 Tax=Actinokineospora cianjurensis TaxID=585224 RepID=A0A421BA21_9PSEU|nr:IniB N-terminal domain-containing protein [Actinokineospora cianjurensis]RLK61224.1 hypothetical protein CLV68_1742 [Actinokineospora cianjurensis]
MSSSGSGQPTQAAQPVAPSEPVAAPTDLPVESGQTLHEFVLGLISDDAARTAFAADPTGALSGAGLGAVSVQDLQDALPYVADYAPAADLHAVSQVLTSATTVTGDIDPGAAAGHLDLGSDWFSSASALDHNDGLHAVTAGATEDLGYAVDLTADDALVGAFALESEQVNGSGQVAVSEDGFAAAAAGSDFGSVTAAANTAGAAAGVDAAGFAFGADLDVSSVDYLDHSDPTAALDAVALPTVEVSAAGTGSLITAGLVDRFDLPGIDPTGALDTDSLRGTDLTAGTVADFVSSGGELLPGSPTDFGGFLTGASPLTEVEEISEHLRATLPQPVPAPEPAQHLPVDTGALPELPELPGHLPALPGDHLPQLPGGLPHLPTDLPQLPHLPVDLPHLPQLPVEVPDLPVANPLPDVASHVSHGVGGLTDGVLGGHHLPDVGGLTGDLDLGH